MASEPKYLQLNLLLECVLILVLVEDGFRVAGADILYARRHVLILVLVEDGFRVLIALSSMIHFLLVLILVLVEDGFRGYVSWQLDYKFQGEGLNPCSCGRWLQSSQNL